ncbi:PREDICTED: 39S ribosomal protein L36, mitochondrial [Propithecus coquereli]|uniref:39S ribosomal protein L36, mitochondrial n=1 Tax=Propithecus coquereli TaxID=379532 RepID=UPI00063FB84C|nr:PREDICTED: 39S ribosomal protein L36, mitochondrial [Propithecus coquereli]
MVTLLLRAAAAAVLPLLRPGPRAAFPPAFSSLLAGAPRGALRPPLWAGPASCLQPALGFKTKGVLRKRCKDCYLVKRRGRWFIYCKTHPRHKQRQM